LLEGNAQTGSSDGAKPRWKKQLEVPAQHPPQMIGTAARDGRSLFRFGKSYGCARLQRLPPGAAIKRERAGLGQKLRFAIRGCGGWDYPGKRSGCGRRFCLVGADQRD
jgi:hypothetical protein